MKPIRTQWYAATDIGAVRRVNEDRYFASAENGVWAVADGMGGHARGDWAATQVIDSLVTLPKSEDLDAMIAEVRTKLENANAVILSEAEARGQQMGSTVLVMVVRDHAFGLCWAGDSRAYLLRDGILHRLTRDHSLVQEMVDLGMIKPEEAFTHPKRNVLTRAVGVSEAFEVDTQTYELLPDDVVLLCSDGLHGVLPEAEMAAILNGARADEASRALIDRCHELGAPDNITLVEVSTAEITLVRFGSTSDGG